MKRRTRPSRFLGSVRRRKRLLTVEAIESRVLLSTLLVNSADDSNARDADLTLREAILVANGELALDALTVEERARITGDLNTGSDADLIHFDLPGDGARTIALTSALPDVIDSVVIDGATQPGYAGSPLVRLLGTGAGGEANGLRLAAGSSTVKGLAIVGFAGAGIAVNSDGNTIQGNHLGIDPDGLTVLGNTGGGVVVTSANNQIGGTTAAERNLITGNGGLFQSPTSLPMDAAPLAVGVLVRSDGGSYLDSLVTLDANGNIQTRVNKGDGTFHAPTTVATLPGATQMIVAGSGITKDINRDGIADLVVANATTGEIHVLLGKSDGAFLAPELVATIASPRAIAMVDQDIAVVSGADGGSVQVLPNSGDGEFGAPITLASGVNPVAITGAYFEYDGDSFEYIWAIAVANRDDNTVTVLERNIDGTYQDPVTISVGTAPVAITAAELTGLGWGISPQDLIVANSGSNDITILLRAAGGGFNVRTFAVGDSPSGVIVGDFDGDFQQDIAVTNAGDNSVSLILRRPSGQLIPAVSHPVGSKPIAIAGGNFSSDDYYLSRPELVTVNGLGDDLSVLLTNTGPIDGITLVGAGATGNIIQGNWIGVDGSGNAAPGNTRAGVFVDGASNNQIGGSAAGAGNLISGNLHYGVGVSGGLGNTIQGNRIGVNAAGNSALGNVQAGVFIEASSANQILDNLISGNLQNGVRIQGVVDFDEAYNPHFTDAANNVIQGNIIGLNAAGDAKLANGKWGVSTEAATGTIIGGSSAGQGNIISGNVDHGVDIRGRGVYNFDTAEIETLGAAGTLIQGNYIGASADGETALGNGGEGVYLQDAPGVTIGGSGAGEGNLISGNGDDGIAVRGSDDAVIQGNRIGTNAAGDAALGNGVDSSKVAAGIFVADSANALIGGSGAGEGNLISGNIGRGLLVSRPKTQGARIEGNLIGTDATGSLPLPNSLDGITIHNSTSNNVIGGTSPGAGNVIAFNGGAGIRIDLGDEPWPSGQLPTGNQLLGNLIVQNTDGAILSPSEAAAPSPSLTLAWLVGDELRLTGNVNGPANATIRVEFFSANPGWPMFLGSASVSLDADGQGTFDVNLPGAPQGLSAVVATATSTNPVLNTSGFSASIPVQSVPPIFVDLVIGQTVAPTTGVVGENLVYTITVQNRSANAANGVSVTSTLPASFTFIASSLAPASNANDVLTFHLGTLAGNETRTLTITARPTAPGEFVHVVAVAGDQTDPNPSDNTSTLKTTVVNPEVPSDPVAHLQLSLTTSPTPIVAGQNAVFTYTVTNAGPDAAADVVFTLTLPAGVILISVDPSQGAVQPSDAASLSTESIQAVNLAAGSSVIVNLGELAAGSSATITIILQPAEAGNLVGEARVTSAATDPNPEDSAIAPVIVVEPGAVTPEPPPAPVVTDLERVGVHYDPTVLVISFSQPLDPSTAEDLNNYALVHPGRDGRLGTRDDRPIPLAWVSYDSMNQTVVLAPRPRLALRGRYGLLIRNGPDGVTGRDGQPLDGDGDGQPGGDFSTVFGPGIWRGGRAAPRSVPAGQHRPLMMTRARVPLPRGPRAMMAHPAFAQRLAMRQAHLRG